MWERKLSLKVEILTRRSLERRDSEGSANFTLTRLRMQEGPKNTADAVLRPGKGDLRSSVSTKFAFLAWIIQDFSGGKRKGALKD
jgi:hypothetical protein